MKIRLRLISIFFVFFSINLSAKTNTYDDAAIWDLVHANALCAAISKVNPEAVKGNYKSYLKDSEKLCFLFHEPNIAKSLCLSYPSTVFKVVINPSVVKVRALNSVKGALTYLNEEGLDKTDAMKCEDLHSVAKTFLLKNYGRSF